jgi:hypothetical protein
VDKYQTKINPYFENNAKGNNRIEIKNIKMCNLNNELFGGIYPQQHKNMGFFTKTIYACSNKKFNTTQGYKWDWN